MLLINDFFSVTFARCTESLVGQVDDSPEEPEPGSGWREGRKPEWLPRCVHNSGASTAIGQCISTQQGAGEQFGPSVPGSQS